MTKKTAGILLALLAAFLLLTSGYFLGRRTGNGVRITAEQPLPVVSSEAISRQLPAGNRAATQSEELLNINTATAEQLEQLPQIGEVIAARIVAYRELHGAFGSITELMNVEGIGEGRMNAIMDYITVR